VPLWRRSSMWSQQERSTLGKLKKVLDVEGMGREIFAFREISGKCKQSGRMDKEKAKKRWTNGKKKRMEKR
jgi:hypothetical protein